MTRPRFFRARASGRRRARTALAALALLIVSSGPSQIAGAQTAAPVDTRAAGSATGIQLVFSRPGSAPIEPPVDMAFGVAAGTLDDVTGDKKALASSFYPGAAVVRPQGLVGLVGFPVLGNFFPPDHPVSKGYASFPGLIPTYPLVVTASSPGEPGNRVDFASELSGLAPTLLPIEVGGFAQEASADPALVAATVRLGTLTVGNPAAFVPPADPVLAKLREAVKPFADLSSTTGPLLAASGVDSLYRALASGPSVKTESGTTLSRLALFGGLLEFGRVRVLAVHEGTAAGVKEVARTTEVGLAKVLGIEVVFDHAGLTVTDKRIPAGASGPVADLLGQILERAGVKVETVTSESTPGAATGRVLAVSFQAQEPTIPGVAPIGAFSRVILKFGEAQSALETSPRAAEPSADVSAGSGAGSGVAGNGAEPASAGASEFSAPSPPTGAADAASAFDVPPAFDDQGAGAPSTLSSAPAAGSQTGAFTEPAASGATALPAPPSTRPRVDPAGSPPGTPVDLAFLDSSREVAAGVKHVGQRVALLGLGGLALALIALRRRSV